VNQPLPQDQAPRQDQRPRVVDVVFAAATPEHRLPMLVAMLVALAIHVAMVVWALHSERSLESWSAAVAARVHAELSREQFVELAKPPPPPPPPPEQKPPPPPPTLPKARAVHRDPPTHRPPPPAQAGNIIAREPNPNAPADLTGEPFVTGTASTYAGGVTTSSGTNPVAVQSREVDPHAPPGAHDRSSPVSLEDADWRSCPWPREAQAEQINEQTVVLRVVVRPDGTVESVKILADPGHGFGPQAFDCALRTRFTPARDRQGRPIKAQSPPLRVRFTR
jgi:protein TonB